MLILKEVIDIDNKKNWEESIDRYKKESSKKKLIILSIMIFTILLSVYSLLKGVTSIGIKEFLKAILKSADKKTNMIIWNIRLPRVLSGIVAGAGLGIAGCVMQTMLGNPLASPSTLGVSNAAAFGANIAIVMFGAGSTRNTKASVVIDNPYIVTLIAFIFALLAMFSILSLARLKNFKPETIILSGVAINSLFAAGSTLIQYFANDFEVAAMVFWTFGDLGRINWREFILMTIVTIIVIVIFFKLRWDLNAIDSGETSAKSLGVEVDKLRFYIMFLSSLLTAIVVSFMGIIGFIGLIAPQSMRRIIGSDHRFLIPASAVTGAAILTIADTISRNIISPIILPVGAITSFFGAPLFLYLLFKEDKQ